jgi:hypothetical protein
MASVDNSPRLTPDLQPLRGHEKAGLILFLLFVLAFGVLVEIRSVYLSTRKTDLNCYLRAGWAVRADKDIYAVTDDNWWHFAYPPLFAVAMVPLADAPKGEDRSSMLPYAVSVAIWLCAACKTSTLALRERRSSAIFCVACNISRRSALSCLTIVFAGGGVKLDKRAAEAAPILGIPVEPI